MYEIYHIKYDTHICCPNTQDDHRGPHVMEIGRSTPAPGATPNKLYRNVYVIHFVISGKGEYYGHPVNGPCAFLECPNTPHWYIVDSDPNAPQWNQYWVMFAGEGVREWMVKAGLPTEPTVFPCPYINQAFQILQKLQQKSTYDNCDDQFRMLSGLLELFSLHAASQKTKLASERKIFTMRTICHYIHGNFATIQEEKELAKLVHLSTSYMRKLFKSEFGISPMQYLAEYRIRCAKMMLTESPCSIQEISEALGFSNSNYFCRVFQKHCDGMSPLAYRKKYSK